MIFLCQKPSDILKRLKLKNQQVITYYMHSLGFIAKFHNIGIGSQV